MTDNNSYTEALTRWKKILKLLTPKKSEVIE